MPNSPFEMNSRQANTKSVNVNRLTLLEKLRENKTKHLAQYNEALIGYRSEVRRVAAKANEDAQAGKYDNHPLYFHEVMPQNHVNDYDQVIAMMEMSIDDVINLEASDVQQYVLDNWSWKGQFAGTVAKYANNH